MKEEIKKCILYLLQLNYSDIIKYLKNLEEHCNNLFELQLIEKVPTLTQFFCILPPI